MKEGKDYQLNQPNKEQSRIDEITSKLSSEIQLLGLELHTVDHYPLMPCAREELEDAKTRIPLIRGYLDAIEEALPQYEANVSRQNKTICNPSLLQNLSFIIGGYAIKEVRI